MTQEKKQPKKRIQLVDVVLERKGSQMFEGRRVRSPVDAANITSNFIKVVLFLLNTKVKYEFLHIV